MKERMYLFIIGLLLGAIIATGAFYVYNKSQSCNCTQNTQSNGQPPSMPSENNQQNSNGQPPEMPSDSNSQTNTQNNNSQTNTQSNN